MELVDASGRRPARARLPEGLEGITRLHGLIAEYMPAEWVDLEPAEAAARVRIAIETDHGSWVQALLAAGYQVYAINPMSVARYRERHSTSGAKSDPGDAHSRAGPGACGVRRSGVSRSGDGRHRGRGGRHHP